MKSINEMKVKEAKEELVEVKKRSKELNELFNIK